VDRYLYKDLTYAVVGAAIEVHRLLGPSYLERVYECALAHEFSLRGIPFERQIRINVQYKDITAGEYKADFMIDKRVIVEIKSATGLIPAFDAQALHYLAATGMRLALLLNFGQESLQIKRIIR